MSDCGTSISGPPSVVLGDCADNIFEGRFVSAAIPETCPRAPRSQSHYRGKLDSHSMGRPSSGSNSAVDDGGAPALDRASLGERCNERLRHVPDRLKQ
jgi:hypothetical protein